MMKKILPYLLTAFMSMFGLNAYAYDIAVKNADGVTIYYWIDNGEAIVAHEIDPGDGINYRNCSGNVVIPESVEYGGKTYRVTSIGSEAFSNSPYLTSVIIPHSVTSIGDEAFKDCYRLSSVNIPNSVTSIESLAFGWCSSLTSVTIPNSVTSIGNSAFYGCSGLESIKVESGNQKYDSRNNCNAIIETSSNTLITGCKNSTIPNSVTSINGSAFLSCSGLTFIAIPNSVTSIGSYAFYGCSSLASIAIPNSVTSIGSYAFYDCSGLASVIIPNSVESIGNYAFLDCSGLTSIKIESGNKVYDSRNNCNAIIKTSSNTLIVGCKNTTIPNGVTSISDNAFRACSGLTSVTIPNSVTSIGTSAFSGCSGLASVIIPLSVTSIGYGAFSGCSGLTSVTIPNSVTSIGSSAFYGCSGLTSVTIPNSVTSIGSSAFEYCSSLTSVTIPNSVTSIGGSAFDGTAWYDNQPDGLVYAGNLAYKYKGVMPVNTQIILREGTLGILTHVFSGCSGLTSITIPNSVTSIGYGAFSGCSGLTSVTIPNSVTSISEYTFSGCSGLTSVTLPNSVTSIDHGVFSGCSGLTTVIIPNSVTSIGGFAFFNCSSLTSITIPNSVTSIDSQAFNGCSGLTSITIPNSVTTIGEYAFSGCSGLTSITIPDSVTSIGHDAFNGTGWYNRQPDGLIYVGKVAYKYKGEMPANTHITIKDGTSEIVSTAFRNCSGLISVTIPNSVTSIGSSVFSGCSGLASITIPNGVTSIGFGAFSGCSGLTSVTIPNSVTSIGVEAFYGCSGLASITIPNGLTSIGDRAFVNCKGLTTIVSEIEKPFEINSWIFSDDTYNVAELIVPYGTRAAYQATEGWNKFTMITEAPDKDAVAFTIDGIAFEGSKSEKIVVVKGVDTKQTSIEIPASVSYDGISYQVSGISDGVFDGSNMAALIWDVEVALPNNAFNNASIGSNFLLYVKSSSYAPSSVKNVVVDGTAQTIVLSDDGGQFYCPQAFTACRISYSHNYSMETGKGSTMGWESIALPFDVQRIIHSTQGEIVPFAAYSSGSNQKPFWLAYMSASGFKRTLDIRANEAYIIAMPNNSSYQDDYILAGDVTFSAENITVPQTPTFNGTFLPAFSFVAKSSSVYALNVNNRYVRYSGSEKPGSVFIRDLRDVRPFEAYLTGNFTRGIVEISFDNGTTDILDVLLSTDDSKEMTIYTLSGQQVARTTQRDFDSVWQQLPKGVYIINGKKWIK